ncbi:MAG: ABC transporter ATP-binding protein [Planctomycetales bacterium]|nr:ABC transporter ATP-binding protein [Planctomycetales bacterium]
MGENEPVVVIDRLTKRFGEFTAIDNLSISLDRGRILGFIGPNGAGKTTTIKVLVGQLRPTSGTASICGEDCVNQARKIKWLVGFMPDSFGAYNNMRVREYLDFFGAAYRIPRNRRGIRIEEVMEFSGATYMKDRYVESLSHGMKQRVAIARTLLHDPEVLILDEPANGLDPQARIEMRELLLRLAAMGKTLIVTSHILPELSRICDTVAIMTHGKLRAFGPLEEIMRRISQQRKIEVQLTSAAEARQAAELVRDLVGPDVDVTSSTTESVVRFPTTKTEKELAAVLAKLVDAGIEVSQFRELQSDLEDTFLTITRKEQESDNREKVALTAQTAAQGDIQ